MLPWHPLDVRPRQLFDRFFEDPWRVVSTFAGNGAPAVEVFARGEDVVVRAEIAGVAPQDVDVRLSEDAVTIRGERRPEERTDQEGYYHSERQYGTFVRTVSLPATVDAARAKARFRNGLLEIVAPRKADDSRRGHKLNIEVQ